MAADEQITELLIKHGANVNSLTRKGQTAMHLISKSRNKFPKMNNMKLILNKASVISNVFV